MQTITVTLDETTPDFNMDRIYGQIQHLPGVVGVNRENIGDVLGIQSAPAKIAKPIKESETVMDWFASW